MMSGEAILLIDHDSKWVEFCKQALKARGYQVDVATRLSKNIPRRSHCPYDAVVVASCTADQAPLDGVRTARC
jgi:DNA-binding response OmpR family regulator